MSQTYLVPLLCTRGVIIFPTQEVNIDVGRSESIKACEYANNNNSYIFVTAQKALDVDRPTKDDIYEYGSLCKIKRFRRKDGYLRVGFIGIYRARMLRQLEVNDIQSVEAEVLEEYYDNEMVMKELFSKVLQEFDRVKLHANPQMNVELLKNLKKFLCPVVFPIPQANTLLVYLFL